MRSTGKPEAQGNLCVLQGGPSRGFLCSWVIILPSFLFYLAPLAFLFFPPVSPSNMYTPSPTGKLLESLNCNWNQNDKRSAGSRHKHNTAPYHDIF